MSMNDSGMPLEVLTQFALGNSKPQIELGEDLIHQNCQHL